MTFYWAVCYSIDACLFFFCVKARIPAFQAMPKKETKPDRAPPPRSAGLQGASIAQGSVARALKQPEGYDEEEAEEKEKEHPKAPLRRKKRKLNKVSSQHTNQVFVCCAWICIHIYK